MKNRAKCKLCASIIESHFEGDVVSCKCGEITVYDGAAMRCEFANIENFLRVDDLGHEIQVRYEEKGAEGNQNKDSDQSGHSATKEELIDAVEYAIENLNQMPIHHVTSKDLADCMLMLIEILKRE